MKERANEDRLTSPSPFQIYWVRDGVEVQPERDPNFLQAADGHLIVVQTRERDRGNYTCVAENVANTRMSPAARLQVVGRLLRCMPYDFADSVQGRPCKRLGTAS